MAERDLAQSRREFLKKGMFATAGIVGATGIGLNSDISDRLIEEFIDEKKEFPEEHFSVEVNRISTEEVAESIRGTRRGYAKLDFQETQGRDYLAQAEINAPSGRLLEVSLKGIENDNPTIHVIEITPRHEDQRRLVALISSPQPQQTKFFIGPFKSETNTLRFAKRAGAAGALHGDQLDGYISFIDDEGAIEKEMMDSVPEIIPRFEHRYDLTREAPYKSYLIPYQVGDRKGYKHISRFLWEKGGTKPNKLYFDTKTDENAPGRTDDVEWTTMSLIKPETSDRVYFQLPHHNPRPYTGVLLDNRRPIVETWSDNNNFVMGTSGKLKQGAFAYVPEIISADEFDATVNSPDKWAQLLSFRGLVGEGQLHGLSDPVIDFLSHHPDLVDFPVE